MIAVIDYGAGNLKSVKTALDYIGAPSVIVSDANELQNAPAAILPGVGSFGDAMHQLKARGLDRAIKEFVHSGRPLLGICLGLQLLFEKSEESPGIEGLCLLKGTIKKIPSEKRKVPQIGWNSLNILKNDGLFSGIRDQECVYFVHSYYLEAAVRGEVAATTSYGVEIDAAVESGNLFATQFHPEKSGEAGLKMLRNFVNIADR